MNTDTSFWTALGAVLIGLNFAWTIIWSVKVSRKVEDSKNDKAIGDHRDRLARLETIIERMPDHNDLEKIHARIGTVNENLSQMRETMGGVTANISSIKRSIDLLNNHKLRDEP